MSIRNVLIISFTLLRSTTKNINIVCSHYLHNIIRLVVSYAPRKAHLSKIVFENTSSVSPHPPEVAINVSRVSIWNCVAVTNTLPQGLRIWRCAFSFTFRACWVTLCNLRHHSRALPLEFQTPFSRERSGAVTSSDEPGGVIVLIDQPERSISLTVVHPPKKKVTWLQA